MYLVFFSVFIVIFIWVFFRPGKTKYAIDSTSNNQEIRLSVEGMMCSGCSGSVTRVLENLPGVKNVSVSYISGTAKLEYDAKKVSIGEISKAIEKAGYKPRKVASGENILNAARELKIRDFRQTGKNLLMGVIPSILVIFLSMYQMFVIPFPDWVNWVLFGLAVFVVAVPGRHFFIETVKQAINRQTNMSTLVSLGVAASISFSLVSLLNPNVTGGILYIEGAVMIVMLVSLGHYIRLKSELTAMKDVFDVASLLPEVAHIAVGELINDINPSELKTGNEVIVRAAERIPADGVVISGETEINNASITGESIPVPVKAGDKVFAGATTGFGTIRVRCEKTGSETVVSRVVEMVSSALSSKPKIQEMVDKIAAIFVPSVFTVAIATFNIWWLLGNPHLAVLTSISVLVISCPCALGLATPTALSVALGIASRKGILIKDAVAFETLLSVKNFVFDKTGTLTVGRPEVNSVLVVSGTKKEMVQLAVSAETGSEHSLAEAIRKYSNEKSINPLPAQNFEALPGLGVKANVDGKTIHVGGPRLLQKLGLDIPLSLAGGFDEDEAVFYVISDSEILGGFGLLDKIRDGAKELIDFIKEAGIHPVLLSGDRKEVCESVAEKLGIKQVYSQVLPDEKLDVLKKLSEDSKTAMMGDGVNDAPALATADVSIAPSGGTGLALDASSITLMREDLSLVIDAMKIAKATNRNVKWSLFWAFFYNVLTIPVAAGILYPQGILLNPMIASGAMALSSIMVVLNAIRLRFVRL